MVDYPRVEAGVKQRVCVQVFISNSYSFFSSTKPRRQHQSSHNSDQLFCLADCCLNCTTTLSLFFLRGHLGDYLIQALTREDLQQVSASMENEEQLATADIYKQQLVL